MNTRTNSLLGLRRSFTALALAASSVLAVGVLPATATADETCVSPYSPKITGQEQFVHVWTLGVEGVGDEQDKLVTIDTDPKSDTFGEVIHTLSVGGRNEAHHSGYSDDRRYLWAGSLDTNKIFIFDVHTDPSKPKLHKVIDDFVKVSGGVVGPHSFFALPGRIMISALSNNKDHGGRTALVEYTNKGEYVDTYWMPTDDHLQGAIKTGKYADGYGYDVRFLPAKNVMVTSSFTGWSNYMMDFGKMLNDPEAMKRFGNTAIVWDLHKREPLKIFDIPGAPLEIRCAWGSNYCFTTTALTAKIWLIYEDREEGWTAREVGTIGDPSKVPLPVAFSITADDSTLWINTFMDGTTRQYDVSDPFDAKLVSEHKIGSQVNMVSQSWDGKRLYFTSSLLGNWDKKGEADEQFLKMYHWDGGENLELVFEVDFYKEKLGRAHLMTFNSNELFKSNIAEEQKLKEGLGDAMAVADAAD
jgi:selenium-binding protein 1